MLNFVQSTFGIIGGTVSGLSRRFKKRLITFGALAVAVLLTGFVIAAAFRPYTPPPSTIDFAAVEAKQKASEAAEKARVAAEVEAGKVVLSFPKDRPLSVMLVGDSVAAGQYSTIEPKSFQALVKAGLSKHGAVEWSSLTFAGAKIIDVLERKSPAVNADLAIIELGLNDQYRLTKLTTFRERYAAYLDRIKTESPAVKFLCMGMWGEPNNLNVSYDQVMEQECVKRAGKFLPLRNDYRFVDRKGPVGVTGWAGVSDATHPNDKGHRVIADLVLARLSKLTGKA